MPDFSDSVKLCLDNGAVTYNNDEEGYMHHSKKECCETHFWFRIAQVRTSLNLMFKSLSFRFGVSDRLFSA